MRRAAVYAAQIRGSHDDRISSETARDVLIVVGALSEQTVHVEDVRNPKWRAAGSESPSDPILSATGVSDLPLFPGFGFGRIRDFLLPK